MTKKDRIRHMPRLFNPLPASPKRGRWINPLPASPNRGRRSKYEMYNLKFYIYIGNREIQCNIENRQSLPPPGLPQAGEEQ